MRFAGHDAVVGSQYASTLAISVPEDERIVGDALQAGAAFGTHGLVVVRLQNLKL